MDNTKIKKKVKSSETIPGDPLKEAVGIWKDKWPEEMSSVEVAKEMREKVIRFNRNFY